MGLWIWRCWFKTPRNWPLSFFPWAARSRTIMKRYQMKVYLKFLAQLAIRPILSQYVQKHETSLYVQIRNRNVWLQITKGPETRYEIGVTFWFPRHTLSHSHQSGVRGVCFQGPPDAGSVASRWLPNNTKYHANSECLLYLNPGWKHKQVESKSHNLNFDRKLKHDQKTEATIMINCSTAYEKKWLFILISVIPKIVKYIQ